MKRLSNLYRQICSLDNLRLADAKACKGKSWQYGVQVHARTREDNLRTIHNSLLSKTYRTSEYTIFKITDPKEREIYRLPYYPDRIVHHAVMNILEPVFVSVFTADTYSCIKKRGIHAAAYSVKNALHDRQGTQYCLKLDIKKFYPNINHDVLKSLLRRKFKDNDLLWLLDEIIDSAPGLPIGNYLSQYLANFYLTYFDHWLKEQMKVRYYFRYADDLVILSDSKQQLHSLFAEIKQYLGRELNLEVKDNWQVFPVEARGIDFVGYVFYHTHIRLRKTIKQNFARMLATRPNQQSIAAYMGWTGHCNANHLTKTLFNVFIQRNGDRSPESCIHRRQNKAEPDTERADNSTQFQSREKQIPGQGQRTTPGASIGIQRQPARFVFWLNNTNGDDTKSASRETSIHNNHPAY